MVSVSAPLAAVESLVACMTLISLLLSVTGAPLYHGDHCRDIANELTGYRMSNYSIRAIMPVLDFIANASTHGVRLAYSPYHAMLCTGTGSEHVSQVHTTTSIPRILHQTWKDRNIQNHAESTLAIQNTISSYASDFLRILWTNADIDYLIDAHYPQLKTLYKGFDRNIKKTDLARYLILSRYGGLYMDLDIELKRNISELLGPRFGRERLEIVTYRPSSFRYQSMEDLAKKNLTFCGNAFLASIPKAEVLDRMVRHITSYKKRPPSSNNHLTRQQKGNNDDVFQHTGPLGLGEVIQRYLQLNQVKEAISRGDGEIIRILGPRQIGNEVDKPAFAVHKKFHNWGD